MSGNVIKRLKSGAGYWDVTTMPMGGDFRRVGVESMGIVKVLGDLSEVPSLLQKGCTECGLTADGRKIAYDGDRCTEAS